MRVKTVIGFANQLAIEPFFVAARFVPRNEQDRFALRVEGKGHSPNAIGRAKPQFLMNCNTYDVNSILLGYRQKHTDNRTIEN